MRKTISFHILYLFIVLALASCQKDEVDSFTARTTDEQVQFSASIRSAADTRALIQNDGKGVFEPGDRIRLYTRSETQGTNDYTLTYDGSGWQPAPKWADVGERARFAALYPIPSSGEAETGYTHVLATDQQLPDAYEASDLLVAQAEAVHGSVVELPFTHALSRVRIRLSGKDYTEQELKEATVEVQTCTRISFPDILDPSSFSTDDGSVQWVTPRTLEDGSRVAVVCPQSMNEFRTSGWIRITIGDKEVVYNAPELMNGESFAKLEAGKEVTVSLAISKKDEPEAEERILLTEGVHIDPEKWIYKYKEDGYQEWTEGCGWYDVNKIDPTQGSPDNKMCWAATASNLLQWWIDRNKDWIETEYREEDYPHKMPTTEKGTPDMVHGEIFETFRKRFGNVSGYTGRGVNWYINGIYRDAPNGTVTGSPEANAGFFRNKYGNRSLVRDWNNVTKEIFNKEVKAALKAGKAVAIAINNNGNQRTNHAVNFWGVELDNEGFIKYLYLVDNNEGSEEKRPYGFIHRKEVQYRAPSGTSGRLNVYITNSQGNFVMNIYQFTVMEQK